MAKLYQTLGSSTRFEEDAFDAGISQIGFVIRRDRPKDWSINQIANPYHDILAFCIEGKAVYECGADRFEVSRGTMLFFPRGIRHSARTIPSDPWSFYSVGFRLEFTNTHVQDRFAQLPVRLRMPHWPQITEQFKFLWRSWNQRQAGFALACRGTVEQLMHHYLITAVQHSLSVPHTARLERIVGLLHEEVGRVYPIHALAQKAGLSESRFRTLFRQFTGHSVTRYQNRLRIHAAQDLLLSGQYTVTQVAQELNFQDVYYFSRLFKKIAGINPSDCLQR